MRWMNLLVPGILPVAWEYWQVYFSQLLSQFWTVPTSSKRLIYPARTINIQSRFYPVSQCDFIPLGGSQGRATSLWFPCSYKTLSVFDRFIYLHLSYSLSSAMGKNTVFMFFGRKNCSNSQCWKDYIMDVLLSWHFPIRRRWNTDIAVSLDYSAEPPLPLKCS